MNAVAQLRLCESQFAGPRTVAFLSRLSASLIVLAALSAAGRAAAQTPPPAGQPAAPADNSDQSETKRQNIDIVGVPPEENIMPTTRSSSSTFGLDLNVMDTPRNTTMLSMEQLQAVNIQDPRSFSYLTSSSYTDSAFGGPNVPRIRGQYADIFYNGMRSSFTYTGYGAPLSFNSIETIDITKGPASVVAGPGAGVGGSADFITKRPGMYAFKGSAEFSFDTEGRHRWDLDISDPIVPGDLAWRISYSGEDSTSYFIGHFIDQQALYGAVTWLPSENYSIDFNTEAVVSNYEENVGVNRVNQQLINSGLYLRGVPNGEDESSFFGFSPGLQVGSPGNPFSPAAPILTTYVLGNPVKINPRITIDETPGTSGHAFLYNAQLIQKYQFSDDTVLQNNTFFDYENRDNQAMYYYADSADGTYTIENRTDLQLKFDMPFAGLLPDTPIKNDVDIGGTFRFAHVNYISNFSNENVGIYDLTTNPALWFFAPDAQILGDAIPYISADGRTQYGVPGRDSTNAGNTAISDLYDVAAFFEDRIEFTPEVSLLVGGREDLLHADVSDPLTTDQVADIPQNHSTPWYADGNANISPVYQFAQWGTAYLTYNYTQSVNPNGGDGGIGAYGTTASDKSLLQATSRLYEAGLKFNLLNNTLFIGSALFHQDRQVQTGAGGTKSARAKINGVEIEMNYQPERHFFATASYSFIRTRLDTNPGFYNYPAQPGTNVDGAGLFAAWLPGQSFDDPGVPQHVFNFLGNYRFDSGIGLRLGLQVTGPIATTASGWLDLANSAFVPANIVANGGYYSAVIIPWQYTLNAAVFYDIGQYEFKLSVYNLTNQRNWEASYPFYGNDFIIHSDPIDAELSMKVNF